MKIKAVGTRRHPLYTPAPPASAPPGTGALQQGGSHAHPHRHRPHRAHTLTPQQPCGTWADVRPKLCHQALPAGGSVVVLSSYIRAPRDQRERGSRHEHDLACTPSGGARMSAATSAGWHGYGVSSRYGDSNLGSGSVELIHQRREARRWWFWRVSHPSQSTRRTR